MSYFWKIDRDYVTPSVNEVLGEAALDARVGVGHGTRPDDASILLRWRTLDDDGEVYFGGEATDSALEAAYEFCLRDAGATSLEVRKGDHWVAVIA